MILVFGRPSPGDGIRVSPVSKHASGLARWRDTLSHDTALLMTEVDVQLPDEVIEDIKNDEDVFYVVDLDPDPPAPGPESGDSGEKNPDKRLSEAGWENALYALQRLGIPAETINEDMTYDMIVSVLRDRMVINQALGGFPPDAPLEAAREVRGKLDSGGFDVDEETQQGIRDTVNEAVRRGAVRRGNPNKR